MPPKAKTPDDSSTSTLISNQLEEIINQLREVKDRMVEQDRKFDRLETLLTETKKENGELKSENIKLKEELSSCKERINHLEQRNRADCVRVFDLPISGDSSDNEVVQQQLYQKVLLPILNGAKANGQIRNIPSIEETIEVAHILPGQKNHKPILCRFRSQRVKQLIMRNKKDFAPRTGSKGERPGAYCHPLYDDITRDTYALMKKIGADERVQASWYASGTIKFRLLNSETIHRVRHIYGDYDNIFI